MVWQDFMYKDIELLETGILADATITCGDRTWKVHKSIIYRCEWFKKAFNGNFEEAQTNNVSIPADEFSPELVDCVISFIYSGGVKMWKLNTHDSLVDACVRLWAIADFLVFKELQNEAMRIIDRYLDDKLKEICVNNPADDEMRMPKKHYEVLLAQIFRGIETAYTTYPHAVPCQQILIDFFHAARVIVISTKAFLGVLKNAPRQFSHDLFIAIIDGRESKWVIHEGSWLNLRLKQQGNCTGCQVQVEDHDGSWAVDPSGSTNSLDLALDVDWRCTSCVEKHGFDRVQD